MADAVATARQKIADLRDDGFDKMKSDVIDYAKEQPTQALLVAAGIGVLVGILLGLRRR